MRGSKIAHASREVFGKRLYFPALVAVAALAAWAGLRSGIPVGSASQPIAIPEEDLAVSIRAKEADVKVVLRSFARQIGARLELDPAIRGKLSIQAEKSPLLEVMNDLCTVYSCEWSLSGDALKVAKLPHK